MKKIIFILTAIVSFYYSSNAQIQMISSGEVGIGVSPTSGYRLYVLGTMSFQGTMNPLIIDGTGYYGTSIHPAGNNMCNAGNSNVAYHVMWSYSYSNPSDKRLKENITDIKNALNIVLQLKGVRYDYKKEYMYNDSIVKNEKVKAKLEADRKNQIGFLAQDVNKILPEVVSHDDSTDIYGIDYSKIVPVLVEAIKELKLQIDSLKQSINKKNSSTSKSAEIPTTVESKDIKTSDVATLSQNSPNPFSQTTSISYYLPETVQNATIYVYDMNGVQLKSYQVNAKGNGSLTINGYELRSGMYLYTLIADGKEVATKRMILTQ